MADAITDSLVLMTDLVKNISLGKLYIEDFYKDNGNPKVIGQGKYTQEKYNRFYTERGDLLRQYQEDMVNIINSRGEIYTEVHKTYATNISASITTEILIDTSITVRFTTLPSKTSTVRGK
jgi:hypothetical protein